MDVENEEEPGEKTGVPQSWEGGTLGEGCGGRWWALPLPRWCARPVWDDAVSVSTRLLDKQVSFPQKRRCFPTFCSFQERKLCRGSVHT